MVLIVTATALGIERILEGIWTAIGQLGGAAWPLNLVNQKLDAVTGQLSESLKPYTKHAEAIMIELATYQKWTTEQLKNAQNDLKKLDTLMTELQGKTKDKQQLQIYASAAAQYLATQGINSVADFVASFKDNPDGG